MEQIEHVFFDLDRTLWDFEANSKATLEELFNELGLNQKLGVDSDRFIEEYKRINELFWTDYRNGIIGKEALRYARFEAAMQFFGYADRELASEMGESYIHRSPRKTALVDGTIEILDYLKERYSLHIITNGFDEVQHIKMEKAGLTPYFQHVITSEKAGAKKPSQVVFSYASALTGALPGNSIMIGDHYEADVIGSLQAGWKAVLYDPERDKRDDEPFVHIHHLSELREIL